MLSISKLTKAEKREKLRLKLKNAPQGATLAGQINRLNTSKKYAGKKRNAK